MCSFIFSFMYYNTIISILNHLYRYLSFQVSVPSLKLAFCGYTHHMGRLRQKKCWTSYRVWRPKTSWDFWRRFAQILRCRGCGLFLCPRHRIPRCHTPSCATPVFGHKLHLISGVNPRESLHIHMYVCVGMCMYIGYIYIHIIRFISLNYTVVPRAPDFSALFKGGVWRPSPQGSGDCQVHWMSLVTSKMFFGWVLIWCWWNSHFLLVESSFFFVQICAGWIITFVC